LSENERTDLARVIDLIPLERKKNTRGPFKTGSLGNISRFDTTRGITETSREYIAEKTRDQLSGVASAANTDISSIRDAVLHLESIMAKNTAARLETVTNAIDSKEEAEDKLGLSITTVLGGSGLDTFGILMIHPTKSGGPTWFSTEWNNAIARNLGEGDFDPNDARFSYSNGDPDTTELEIMGNGECRITEFNDSTRLRVHDTWLNTEQTIYQFVETSDDTYHDIQPRSRSRHETSCSFGNYLIKFRDTRGDTGQAEPVDPPETLVSIECEVLHPHYRRHLDEHVWGGIVKGQWMGFKIVTRDMTETGYIKVEGYVNYDITKQTMSDWIKITEFIFTGANVFPDAGWPNEPDVIACSGSGDGQADKMIAGNLNMFLYKQTGNECWWRINGMKNTRWKFASVREINPLP
jgi:hypothetical protein